MMVTEEELLALHRRAEEAEKRAPRMTVQAAVELVARYHRALQAMRVRTVVIGVDGVLHRDHALVEEALAAEDALVFALSGTHLQDIARGKP